MNTLCATLKPKAKKGIMSSEETTNSGYQRRRRIARKKKYTEQKKSQSFLQINKNGEVIELAKFSIRKDRVATVRGFSRGKFICRIELHEDGIKVYSGRIGGEHRKTITWEQMVEIEE
jgi:hypothetical protein